MSSEEIEASINQIKDAGEALFQLVIRIATEMNLPPARVFEVIGLRRILAGLPDTWKDALENWVDERRSSPPSSAVPAEFPIPDDLSIPDWMKQTERAS